MTPVTVTQYRYSDTFFGFNWFHLILKMTGYSDTPPTITLFGRPNTVTVSGVFPVVQTSKFIPFCAYPIGYGPITMKLDPRFITSGIHD